MPICEDINEYAFDDEWDSDIEITNINSPTLPVEEMSSDAESEIELKESRALSKKYFGNNAINPALLYMLEYSGLPEDQILSLLEQNKKKDSKDIKNTSNELQQIAFFKKQDYENKDNIPHIHQEISTSEDKEFPVLDSTESTKSFDTPLTKLSELNTESNINVSPVVASNASNTEQIESIEATVISSTDSDSDDFVEIEDVPIPNIDNDVNDKTSEQGIVITFRSDQKIENDMFADVFETSNSELNAEVKSQNTSLSNEFPKKLINCFSISQETLEDKVISEEAVVKTTENKFKDQQLPDVGKQGDIEMKFIENNADIENTNRELEKDQTKVTNSPENVINSQIDNVEIINIQDDTSVDVPTDDSRRISPLPVNEDELLSLQVHKYY